MTTGKNQELALRFPQAGKQSVVWCAESCQRKRKDERRILCGLSHEHGYALRCFGRAFSYASWLSEMCKVNAACHVLITDWREFKPCKYVLDRVPEQDRPRMMILVLDCQKTRRKAQAYVNELERENFHPTVVIVEATADLSGMVSQAFSRGPSRSSSFADTAYASLLDAGQSVEGSQRSDPDLQGSSTQPFWRSISCDNYFVVESIRNAFPYHNSEELLAVLEATAPEVYSE